MPHKIPFEHIGYIPVPRICSGIIVNVIDERVYEVSIYSSPKGQFNGPIQCGAVYQPAMSSNYKVNDIVKVMVYFLFGGVDNRYHELASGHSPYIIGLFRENSFITKKLDIPNSKKDDETIGIVNENSGAGFVANDYGHAVMSSGGTSYNMIKPFGTGTEKELSISMAQNFKRIITSNAPLYLTREHFGMYSGSDAIEEATKLTPEDIYIIRRSYTQSNTDFKNWVSTCEGHFAPFVGANNHYEKMIKTKDSIFSRIINKDKTRITIEVGESDKDFLQIRIDDVKLSEKQLPVPPGATPALLGNRFKFIISQDGSFELNSNGNGVPGTADFGLVIKGSSDGLNIFCKNKISISHSDKDVTNNSIVLDPNKGIDVNAENGFRVNGKEVVLNSFIEWFENSKEMIGLATTIGGPVPIHPISLGKFEIGKASISRMGGFTSKNTGAPSLGVNVKPDTYRSV